MKKSRKLLMILGIVLSLAVATGTTLAYLTDTDSDVNVMTLGNVDITQLENGEAENGFENGQPLYPAYYEDEIDWETNEGVVDKEVTVENTGKSDAYVRTWFAFEAGEMSYEEFQKYILLNIKDSTEWTWAWDENIYPIANENGEVSNYYIAVATRKEALPAGETTDATLLDVAMSKEATNEIVEAMGEYYTVLVMTQAVQVNGFEELGAAAALAEGFVDAEVANGAIGVNHPWDEGFTQNYPVPPTKVHNLEELNAVVGIENPGDAIFANDIEAGTKTADMKGGTIDGDGYAITGTSKPIINPTGGTIKNVKISGDPTVHAITLNGVYGIGSNQYARTTLTDDLYIENVEIRKSGQAINMNANGHDVYVKDSIIANDIEIGDAESLIFENCHFVCDANSNKNQSLFHLLGDVTFINCHFEESVNFYLDNTKWSGTLTFTGCTYGNNGVEDRPFEPTVDFFAFWMNPQGIAGHNNTFGEGKPANISFTCIVDGTTVWEAQK